MNVDKVKSQFLNDVAEHEMTIINDDGVVNRRIVFEKRGTKVGCFEIVTWPNSLCISGDYGTYVFQRKYDMFDFFCNSDSKKEDLKINESYWGEKLLSIDRRGGYTCFSPEAFERCVLEHFDYFVEDKGEELSRFDAAELLTAIKRSVLCYDNERDALESADIFSHNGFTFTDFIDDIRDIHDYSYQYLWSICAIYWGICIYFETLKKDKKLKVFLMSAEQEYWAALSKEDAVKDYVENTGELPDNDVFHQLDDGEMNSLKIILPETGEQMTFAEYMDTHIKQYAYMPCLFCGADN